jgi:hypothetical protein
MSSRTLIKDLLGELPYTAELYWLLRHRDSKLHSRFNLELLANRMPEMVAQVAPHARSASPGKKIFFFATLHFWIQHAVVTGLALRGLGHHVTLGYFPYSDYGKPVNRFDLRRQDIYAKNVLAGSHPLLETVSFLETKRTSKIPTKLLRAVEEVTKFDTQYILQREDVSGLEPIYLLRMDRNLEAAQKAFAYFQQHRPDVVIVPNGMIQEFGAVYEAARLLEIPTVTYEFGEQNQRTWIGHDQKVMYYEGVDNLWKVRQDRKLTDEQRSKLEAFLKGRQRRQPGQQFAHLWQKIDREGGAKIRSSLGLDDRPVVVLPTNVLGDSATLGRAIFTKSMGEWIERVLPILAKKSNVQLVVRIHPAETNTVGPSVAELIRRILPELPAHIHLIGPAENVNTYDLMEIANLALVYTTNAGLEMATRGVPVLVSGRAHYRNRGFTNDAESWDEYARKLEQVLTDLPAYKMTLEQIDQAWNFAYSFYFEYPRPFPWHIEKIRPDLDKHPLAYVLGPDGRVNYENTFKQFAGELPDWESL